MTRNSELSGRRLRLLALLAAGVMLIAACGASDDAADQAAGDQENDDTTESLDSGDSPEAMAMEDDGPEPVSVCELAYYTGEFAAFGPFLTADVRFPVEEVINLDPPLGRPWELYHEDLGTLGEAQATRYCLDEHDADIVVSIAHGYATFRNKMLSVWASEDGPLAPTVHGGSIPGNLGGSAEEPIFRAQGLDEGLGTSGLLYAEQAGFERIVVIATDLEGFQVAADAAEETAEAIGIEILTRIDVPAEQASYADAIGILGIEQPDAVVVQAGVLDSATLLKQADAAGLSLDWIGETGWAQPSFLEALGPDPLTSQRSIGFAAFSPRESTPAWEFFSQLWNETPGYGDTHGDASDPYHFSTYDLLIQTALAVEAGGSYGAGDWAPAMHEVGEAPGEVCSIYSECLALLRAGEDIDYEGVTGTGDYTAGGVNNVSQTYTRFDRNGSKLRPVEIDPVRSLEIIELIANQAECDRPTLPNVCGW